MNPLTTAGLVLLCGAIGWQVLAIVRRAMERRRLQVMPRVVRVFERAMLLYAAVAAVVIVLPMVGISPGWQEKTAHIAGTLATAVVVARLLRELLQSGIQREHAAPLAASLLRSMTSAAVFVVALVVVLATLGVNITGMVAAIGAGGLVVGLALQETLANFFAGLYILLTGKVRVGDYVQFDTFEGTVEDITWRTTLLRRATNALLVVPNQRLSSSVLTVFRAEQSPVMVRLEFLLEPSADLDCAESAIRQALEELLASGRLDGLLAEPPVAVRFGETAALGVQMIVWVPARNVGSLFDVRAGAMRACVQALVRAGIPLVVLRQ
jgi:small-conductance mechanosensitive channel